MQLQTSQNEQPVFIIKDMNLWKICREIIEKTLVSSRYREPKSIADVFEIHNEACKMSHNYINNLRN